MTILYIKTEYIQDNPEIVKWLDNSVGKENYERRGTAVANAVTFELHSAIWFKNEKDATMFKLKWQ